MQAMSLNFALVQKENTSLQPVKIKALYISYEWYFKRFVEVLNASL